MPKPRIKVRYHEPKGGEWIRPIRRGYRLACCTCGLVHLMDHRLVKRGRGHLIEMRFYLDRRSTAAIRRHMKRHG